MSSAAAPAASPAGGSAGFSPMTVALSSAQSTLKWAVSSTGSLLSKSWKWLSSDEGNLKIDQTAALLSSGSSAYGTATCLTPVFKVDCIASTLKKRFELGSDTALHVADLKFSSSRDKTVRFVMGAFHLGRVVEAGYYWMYPKDSDGVIQSAIYEMTDDVHSPVDLNLFDIPWHLRKVYQYWFTMPSAPQVAVVVKP